jgi:hypothetical protein
MDTRHHRRRGGARAVLVLTLAVLMLLVSAASASAAPTEPTLTLEELRAKLEIAPLTGYMKTVVSGYTIEQIPLTVEALVEWSSGSMILLEATGPVIDDIGGVAAGMSGSPVYVDDDGVDKLVGAVSYGDIFTLHGMALATPIEYMAAIEDDYGVVPPAPGAYPLRAPVETGAGDVETVVIASSQRAAKAIDVKAGTSVMAPLALLQIGGMPPQSKAYKELAAKLEQQTGLTARPASGSSLWTGPPAPALEAGSSICQIFTLGSIWFGAAGTATYVNGDAVVAFGHPSWWTGPCGAAMTAGYVSAIWPSTFVPYKLIAPRDVKGVITQDRNWGIGGAVGMDPDWIPVNMHASFPEEGRDVTTESSCVEWAFQNKLYAGMPVYLLEEALWDACDAWILPGSATTNLTVVVSDETGTYTVAIEDVCDSYDITWEPIWDVYDVLWALARDPDGVLNTRLESIDFDATISSQRISARPVDIILPNGLKTGDNEVQITYYGYGSSELKTLSTTLTLPEGKPTSGAIEVMPAAWHSWWWDEEGDDDPAPDTLAEIVADVNDQPKNSDLLLTFYPRPEGSWGGGSDSSAPAMNASLKGVDEEADTTYDPVETTVTTDWVFDDYLYNATVPMILESMRAKVDYGARAQLMGMVMGIEDDVTVSIYRVDAKTGTETFVKTVTAAYQEGSAFFETRAAVAPHNTTFVARVGAVDDWLPGSAEQKVKVRSAIALSSSVSGRSMTITARVKPADTGGFITFQRYSAGRWRTVKTATVTATGIAKVSWKAPGDGTYRWRAKTFGSTLNAAETSTVKRVVID